MATDDTHLTAGPAESLTTTSAGDVDRIARESLKAWAKKTLGAPRRLDKMVSLVRQEEQDFVRERAPEAAPRLDRSAADRAVRRAAVVRAESAARSPGSGSAGAVLAADAADR